MNLSKFKPNLSKKIIQQSNKKKKAILNIDFNTVTRILVFVF